MNIATVHYHLRPGGVTRVIENAREALRRKNIRMAVLAGEKPDDEVPDLRVIPALAYHGQAPQTTPEDLADALQSGARGLLGTDPDVWHVHNHSLGKNAVVPLAVRTLIERGCPAILQIHDFAEDGRPDNYRFLVDHVADGNPKDLGKHLYPVAEHVIYAVLNGRDHRCLAQAGVPESHLALLANPVWLEPPNADAHPPPREPLFIYPTRAIRRKNLGEFLALAASRRDGSRFAVTLAPRNPAARPVYERWVAIAQELRLPVEFEYGARVDRPFPDMLAGAAAVLTTSIAEGFGLAFLEPFLAGTPLLGRNLPEITREFDLEGVDLSNLYAALPVPVDWIDRDELQHRVHHALTNSMTDYGRPVDDALLRQTLDSLIQDDMVDLGRLNEPLQEQVLHRLHNDTGARERFARTCPLATDETTARTVAANAEVVRRTFSLDAYGKRLRNLYERVANASPGAVRHADGQRLLDQFLDPARFNLLRTGTPR